MKNATDNDPNLGPELFNAYSDDYRKNCFDCNIQTDSCVLVGFYVFSAIIIVLKQIIKVISKRCARHSQKKLKEMEMKKIDI